MSLEDKIINPMAPAELPGQRSEPLPKTGKKRRKSGGKAGAVSGKAKTSELDDEVGGDTTAVLTLGPSDDAPRRPQKKMLFESASEGATLAFAGPAIRRETSRPAPVGPVAIAPAAPAAKTPSVAKPEPVAAAPIEAKAAPQPAPAEPVPTPEAVTPAPQVEAVAPAPAAEAKPAPQPPAPASPKSETKDSTIAATKAPVFQVAALAKREPEPQPEPKDEASAVQAELPLAIEPAADDVTAAPAEVAPAPEAKSEERFEDSLTLAFDATLADGLAERMAAAQENRASEPDMPAPTPSPVPEPVALQPLEPPALVETVVQAAPQPAPAPVYAVPAAPVAEAPKVESKPESEAPSRGLSRSEAIARAARMSARATPRPAPTAAETLAAARTAQQQMRSADLPKTPGDIYGYWTRVKNGRRFPSRADFDADQVAEHWPNSMLLTCGSGIGAGSHGSFSSVLRLGANRRNRPGEDLNFTSMITEWILTTGGEAARAGAPVQDTEVFPTPEGTHAYKIVALPLSENQTRVDHVLCHLSRS